MNCRSQGDI